MINKEEFTVIHTLHKQGHSIRAISKILNLNRRTVSKRLAEQELRPYKKIEYKSKLDPYKEYIISRVQKALPDKIPSTVIYEEIKKYGYDGKIRIIQTFLQSHVSYKPKEEVIRFETEPAYQAQVDWTFIIPQENKTIFGTVNNSVSIR